MELRVRHAPGEEIEPEELQRRPYQRRGQSPKGEADAPDTEGQDDELAGGVGSQARIEEAGDDEGKPAEDVHGVNQPVEAEQVGEVPGGERGDGGFARRPRVSEDPEQGYETHPRQRVEAGVEESRSDQRATDRRDRVALQRRRVDAGRGRRRPRYHRLRLGGAALTIHAREC